MILFVYFTTICNFMLHPTHSYYRHMVIEALVPHDHDGEDYSYLEVLLNAEKYVRRRDISPQSNLKVIHHQGLQ